MQTSFEFLNHDETVILDSELSGRTFYIFFPNNYHEKVASTMSDDVLLLSEEDNGDNNFRFVCNECQNLLLPKHISAFEDDDCILCQILVHDCCSCLSNELAKRSVR